MGMLLSVFSAWDWSQKRERKTSKPVHTEINIALETNAPRMYRAMWLPLPEISRKDQLSYFWIHVTSKGQGEVEYSEN